MRNKQRNLILLNGEILIFVFVLISSCNANSKEENAIVEYLSKNDFLNGKAEIVFLLDRSGSVGAANFETEKGFVESFLTHIVVDANASRVAVISYSDTAECHIDFLKEPKTKCFLSQQLQEVVFKDSRATNTAAALEMARVVFENARPNVNKVLILVSDGFSTRGGDPVPYADRLKASGVEIFCFGIGKSIERELQSLASSKQHVYSCSGFWDFHRLAKRIRGDPHESSWSGQAATPNCDHLCDSPYRGEPNDPGCCDHSARCSCALLSGMHTCVCGPGYYGLSGLAGHCIACPIGTYKSKLEPVRQCTPCPPGSTTAKQAGTSLRDCVCKKGYRGDPSKDIPCSVVKCPPLQKPTHGHLLGRCETEMPFETECHFMCEQGYEMVDDTSDVRTCQSDGTWSGKSALCRPIRCLKPAKPGFGHINCDRENLVVGSKCRFSCYRGYIMEGSPERECLSSQRWSGTKVTCIPVQCELPPQLRHGHVIGCRTSEKPEFFDTCYFRCNHGFRLEGPAYVVCRENGRLMDPWNRQDSKPFCKDEIPPEVTCPAPMAVAAEKGSKGVFVEWTPPQPTDNSGILPSLFSFPEHLHPPAYIEIGKTSIQYVAMDEAGLKTGCNFEIVVYDEEPPSVVRCPSTIEITSDDVLEPAFWQEPLFEDNSGEPPTIQRSHRPGDKFSPGRHTVTYWAHDAHSNEAKCVFDVIMTRNTCPYYPAPTNGAFSCEDWLSGQICQVFCNERYDFVEQPAEWYICNEKSRWVTMPDNRPIPWPDCASRTVPGKIRHMMRGFYYRGDCNDPEVQRYIKKVFLNRLSQKFEQTELCVRQGACSLDTVRVACGKTTDHLAKFRRRRDVWEHAQKENLELEFEITIDVDQQLNDTDAVFENFLETIQNLKWDMDEDFALQTTTLPPSAESDVAESSHTNESLAASLVFTEEETTLECKPGSVLNDDVCVLCSPGTFYEASTQKCWDCPLGHYQEEEGRMECVMCPDGMGTEYRRSRNITDCKGICRPGTHSPTGLETCVSCPVGTFQEHVGQRTCSECPPGTTTAASQSVSASDCRAICEAGSSSHSGVQPCDACPRGFYQPHTGKTSCMECAANFSTLNEGSTSASDCLDLDPCAEEDGCSDHGVCERLGRGFTCRCGDGFEGERCAEDVDECLQKPCFNDGVCINEVGSFHCNCTGGFTGTFCDVELDECLSSPCFNNGTCLDKVNDYACVCPAGYEGPQCERAQEVCYPDILCLNGGTCVQGEEEEGSNSSFCACQDGYAGVDCSVDVDDCENVTCNHNGRCVDEVAAFKCICQSGYTGPTCDTDIDECAVHQCWGGSTCQDLVGRYECLCPPGWSGTFCETKLSDDFVLNFPDSKATIANMASMTLNSPLSDVTVSMWVQTTDTQRSGTPLSYAVASTSVADGHSTLLDNALTINDCSGVHIYINNEPLATEVQVADGDWHHLAFTWSSENSGEWTLYKDGKQQSNGTNLRPNDIIAGGGSLVIGQEQDDIGGGFSPVEAFTGNITRVNVWNSYFSKSNVSRLCTLEDDIPGKVVAWPDFLSGVRGNVNILQNQRPM